jgi:hypothetical protein
MLLIEIYEIRLNLFHSPIQPSNNPKSAPKIPPPKSLQTPPKPKTKVKKKKSKFKMATINLKPQNPNPYTCPMPNLKTGIRFSFYKICLIFVLNTCWN